MRAIIYSLCLLISLSVSVKAHAQDMALGGLLVNKTITWFGQDFFAYFSREWRNQSISSRKNLLIEEEPSAKSGTAIRIYYENRLVYSTSITGTRSSSRKRGEQAVSQVIAQLQNVDISLASNEVGDLAGDEI
ncbi:MAG: curli production assembly/transport component CsgE [Flavobacteriales bacterium]|jgi:curli production assembly/transport component CsgE